MSDDELLAEAEAMLTGRLTEDVLAERADEPQFDSPPDWRTIARALHARLRKIEQIVMYRDTSEAMDAYDDAVAWEDIHE